MKKLLLGLIAAAAVAGCATTTSPTGRTQYVGAVSQAQLDQMGAQAFDETKSGTPPTRDTKQLAYVRCVVTALVRELPADSGQGTAWDTAVFVNDEPNALALPGGKVVVSTATFKVARNKDKLPTGIGNTM